MMTYRTLVGAALLVAMTVMPTIASGQAVPVAASAVLVRSGDQRLTVGEVRNLLGMQSEEVRRQLLSDPKRLEEYLRGEAERKALLAEARKAGIDKRQEVLAIVERAQAQIVLNAYLTPQVAVPVGYPNEADVGQYYERNKARFAVPEQLNISTIYLVLLPAWAGDPAIRAAVHSEAAKLVEELRKGADFAELARRHSQDRPTADKGGAVGWVTAGQLLPEIAQAAQTLNVGEVSEPIATSLGFHVIRVNDRLPPQQRSLAEVRNEVARLLQLEYRARKEREVIDAAVKQNPISFDHTTLERWRLGDLRGQGAR